MALFSRRTPARDTSFGDAHFLTEEELKSHDLLGQREGIPLGHYPADSSPRQPRQPVLYASDQHLVLIAPSRTGKGTTAIVPTLLSHDASMLVIDPKGQNAAVTARRRRDLHGHTEQDRRVFVVNPFGLHQGEPWRLDKHKFNPLAAINTKDDNFVADVSSLCEAIILSEGHEPHWANAARDLVSAICMHMKLTMPEKATLPRMRAYLTDDWEMFHKLVLSMMQSKEPAVRQRASRFADDSREVRTVLSTAITQTSFLDDPMIAESLNGDDFRLLDLKRKRMTVYLVLPSRYLAAYFRWLRLFVVSAIDALTSTADRPAKPVLFVLDEFASLGHLTAIETAMALAAGYGVQLWPILQDLNQVKTIYSDRWETFLANAGVVQVFRPNDLTTVKYFSERGGTYTHRLTGFSYVTAETDAARADTAGPVDNISRQFSLVERRLCTPQELLGMKNDVQVVFKSGSGFPAKLGREPYYDPHSRYSRERLYDRDPYHS